MNNFEIDEEKDTITYREPEDTEHYVASITLASQYEGNHVGLCLHAVGNGNSVALGINDEIDIQHFLYSAAVRGKLIRDGEALILMKPIEEQEEAA